MKKLTKREIKEIREIFDEAGGYMSYDDKIEWVMEEYGLTEEEAEGIVWNSTFPEWMMP